MYVIANPSVCIFMFQFGLVFVIRVSYEKLKFDYNQTWVKDAIGVPLYVNEVKGHIPRSRVI